MPEPGLNVESTSEARTRYSPPPQNDIKTPGTHPRRRDARVWLADAHRRDSTPDVDIHWWVNVGYTPRDKLVVQYGLAIQQLGWWHHVVRDSVVVRDVTPADGRYEKFIKRETATG